MANGKGNARPTRGGFKAPAKAAKLYGVFTPGTTKWGMTTNEKMAVDYATREGAEVRWMPYPDTKYWDLPTFYACSEPLHPSPVAG